MWFPFRMSDRSPLSEGTCASGVVSQNLPFFGREIDVQNF